MEKQELEELKVSIYEKLRRAIEKGDKEKALELLSEIDVNRKKYLDFPLSMVDYLFTLGAEKIGEEFVNEANRIFAEQKQYPALDWALGSVNIEDKLRKRAYIWTSLHGANIEKLTEDEEKFTIKVKCPTGGSIVLKEEHGKTKKAHPWSLGRKGLSYYCAHCVISMEVISMERFGYPAWVNMPSADGRCTQYIYKDPQSIPEEYYERAGMKKPSK